MGLDVDDAFDGDFVRLIGFDDGREVGVDGGEGGGLDDFLGDGDDVEGEDRGFARIAFEDGVAGVADGGVDGEDSHGILRVLPLEFAGDPFGIPAKIENGEDGNC